MHPLLVNRIRTRAARRLAPAALLIALAPAAATAQQPRPGTPVPNSASAPASSFAVGLGMTTIDGQNYYLFNASPEFNFGQFGLGLDLNLRFDADSGKLYKEDWRNGRDAFKAIRYISWGSKEGGSRFYVRGGELSRTTLGFGQIMYLYNNSPSYDARKRGAEMALDLGAFGVEAVYADFARPGVTAGRAYVRPLSAMSLPIVSRLEVGASVAADLTKDAGMFGTQDYGTPTVYGADIGLPIIANPLARFTIYGDMAKIRDAGSGQAVGAQLAFNGLGLVHLSTRMEQRFIGDQYMPSFFNSMYEIQRYTLVNGLPVTQLGAVMQSVSPGNGMYGELTGDVIGIVTATGSYQRLYKQPNSGWLHMDVGTGDKVPNIVLKGSYDKWNVGNETGLFELDANSLARLETGYRPNRFMTVSLLTEWTFAPIRNGDDVVGYTTQKRIEPKVTFGFAF